MHSDVTVYLVDDDSEMRTSLSWMLERAGYSVDTFETGTAALDGYAEDRPGCLVIDLSLPDMTGIELYERLREEGCRHPFLIITGHGDVPQAVDAMREGAIDFIEKPFESEGFLSSVALAVKRDGVDRALHAKTDGFRRRLERLSPRENEVLALVVDGKLTKQIAADLDISVKTVEVHRSNIFKKLGVDTATQLVATVLKHGLMVGGK